jgi:hypothetical protein
MRTDVLSSLARDEGGLCEICTVMEWFVPHALAGDAQLRSLLYVANGLASKNKITIAAARCPQ